MISYFLFLLLLLCVTNTIHAVADNEFPPYLSFHQYRSVQSFAGDEDNQLINELGSNGWDNSVLDTWYMNLNLAKENISLKTDVLNNNANDLFPFIICDTNESDRHGVDRYEFIDSVLSKMCGENENDNVNDNTSKYFIKSNPIYNRNHKSKNKDDNDENALHGACFFSSIEASLARSVEEEGILVTPVAPFLKMRKNISGSLDNYDEENSIDEDTISLSVTLAPGSFSSHDAAVEFASNVQQLQDMDENDPFLNECDKKPYQRSSITVGFSNSFYFFFYEFEKQDLVAGITHKCHRLFLEHIATKPHVISVEKVAKNTISNYHAKWIVESSVKEKNPLTDIGLSGNGEVIFVADTGLDQQHCYIKDYSGDTVPLTTDFDLTGKINHDLRKVVQYAVLNDIGIDSDDQDLNGHGTHVVGTIVGKRLNGNGQETQGVGEGIASSAKVAFYDGNSGDSKDVSVNSIISQFFYFGKKAGARINSSSWNSGLFGEYDEKSRQVDEYFYNDPDDEMLMINSSGNDGETDTGTATVGTVKYPCVSKNALCIGASHNYDLDMDDIDVVAFFSSYGPTADRRIKPDLIAPGHRILSLEANSNKCGASQYDSAGNNDGLTFKSGTSMACPVVAGAGALVREYFTAGYYPSGEKGIEKMDISGSLLKAVLINGAVELKHRSKPGGGYEDSEYYDRYQGFGIINLVNSLKLANEVSSPDLYVENERIIEKGQTHEYVFDDVCNDHGFRVTLVWRDPPGDSGCVECLVNDLDLEVLYDGTTYYPNGRSNRDEKNNVERVILKKSKFVNPNGNTIRVRVKTANLGADVEQKYSLASTGCFNSAEVEFNDPEPTTMCGPDEFEYSIDIFTNRKPEETSWVLEYQGSKGNLAAARTGQYDEMLHLYREIGCATVGECFIFVIKDTAFNGLCCEKGMGSYLVRVGDEVLLQRDSFGGRQEIEKFCHIDSNTDIPTVSPTIVCNDNEFKYLIDIETDLFPDETRWELRSSELNQLIDSVPFMTYQDQFESYSHVGCLTYGSCYELQMIDKRRDGLCCYFGSGSYKLIVGDDVVVQGNNFDDATHGGHLWKGYFYNSHAFCYDRPSPDTPPSFAVQPTSKPSEMTCEIDEFEYRIRVRTDYHPYDLGWIFTNANSGEVIESVKQGEYFLQHYEHNHRGCLPLNDCFEFYIRAYYGGLCCKYGNGGYTIFADDIVMVEGGESFSADYDYGYFIFSKDTKFFCNGPLASLSPSSQASMQPSFDCSDSQFLYELEIITSKRPGMTYWELFYDDDGMPIDYVVEGHYSGKKNTKFTHGGCIDQNRCLFLSCFYGQYTMKVNGDIVAEGDASYDGESEEFCYTNPVDCDTNESSYVFTITTDEYPEATSWELKYTDGTLIDGIEEGSYMEVNAKYTHVGCIDLNSCVTYTIQTSYGWGFYGEYSIIVNDDDVVVQGGQFDGDKETKTFCYGPLASLSPSAQASMKPTLSCSDSQFIYEVVVITPYWNPEETSWYLSYYDYTDIKYKSPGSYTEGNTKYTHNGCIDQNRCAMWYGSYGKFTVKVNGDIVVEGDYNYGEHADDFCYTNPVDCDTNESSYVFTITTDEYPEATSWELKYTDGTLIDGIEEGSYMEGNTKYTHVGCIDLNSCVTYKIQTSYGWGFYGEYSIIVNDDDVVVQGGQFDGDEETKTFCYGPLASLSPSSQTSMKPCGDNQFIYEVEIITPYSNPEDTQWYLFYYDDYFYYISINYKEEGYYTEGNTKYTHGGCIDQNICAEWYSSYAKFTVKVNGDIVVEGDYNYGSHTDYFCYTDPYSLSTSSSVVCESRYDIIITTDDFPQLTSWELSYEDGTLIRNIGQGYYTQANTEYAHNGCLDLASCVTFTIEASYYGLCCFYGNGGYTIMANDVVMAEGDYFYHSETKKFCHDPSSSFSPSSTVCEDGSNNHYNCGDWAYMGMCDESNTHDWMFENCAKACHKCCVDYAEFCDDYAFWGACTYTGQRWIYDHTWQEFMQAKCRASCNTCDLDFTPSPTPAVVCSDDDSFKYEIVVTNDDYYYFRWNLLYKYPDLVDGYQKPGSDYYYGEFDSNFRQMYYFPPNYEKRYYGCAKFSCFKMKVKHAYLKIYDVDKGILVAQNTEPYADIRFCNYAPDPTTSPTISVLPSATPITPPDEALITITLTSSSLSSEDDVSKVVQSSVYKILSQDGSSKIDQSFDNLIVNIDLTFCEDFTCEVILQICNGSCDVSVEADFMDFVANTMSEAMSSGEFLQTLKETAEELGIGGFDSLIADDIGMIIDFDYPTQTPTSKPISPSTPTEAPTQENCKPTIEQLLENPMSYMLELIQSFVFFLSALFSSFMSIFNRM